MEICFDRLVKPELQAIIEDTVILASGDLTELVLAELSTYFSQNRKLQMPLFKGTKLTFEDLIS